MTHRSLSQFHCYARAILANLNSVAANRGAIRRGQYPLLIEALGHQDCRCTKPHAEDALAEYLRFGYPVKFIDGFTLTVEQAQEALEHHFFGGGSLEDRRNHIISAIFGIENEDKDAPNYRSGWSIGRYRTTKEEQLLWPLAQILAGNLLFGDDGDEPSEAEFDFEAAELDLTRKDGEAA